MYVGGEEESWDCLLDPDDGAEIVKVPKVVVNTSNVISGETTLFAPGMAIVNDQITVDRPSDVVLGDNMRRDRRLQSQGTMQVVIVRISCDSNSVTKSLDEIKGDIFYDASCLKTQMEGCSNTALNVVPGPNDGGFDIWLPGCQDESSLRDRAIVKLTGLLGHAPEALPNTKYMFCMPPNLGWRGIAYAWVNYYLSVYNNEWCSFVSVHMHEVGHNLNLAHSGERGNEYGDETGFMGFSYSNDDQRMCYNAAHMYQLGWLTNVAQYSSQPAGVFTLVGHTNPRGLQAIRLTGTPPSQDTYIWFNHQAGINANTVEGGNQVIVTTRPSGTEYGMTDMVAKLGVGGTYRNTNTYYDTVRVMGMGDGWAAVSFGYAQPTPQPTPEAAPPVKKSCPTTTKSSLCKSPCLFFKKVCFAPGRYPCSRSTKQSTCPSAYCRWSNLRCANK